MTDLQILNAKIIIVDDLPPARKVMNALLQKAGFTNIREAADGTEALELIKTESFDLVITDWKMPKMSGLELIQALKNDPKLNLLPVIMVTATSDKEEVIEAANAGAKEYIVKPFDHKVLLSRIEKVLAK